MLVENIRLKEALAKESNCIVHVWSTSGLQIDVGDDIIPKNATVCETLVSKFHSGDFDVFVRLEDSTMTTLLVDRFLSLEELESKFPTLFELEGDLYYLD